MDREKYFREVRKDRRFAIAFGVLVGAAGALLAVNQFLAGLISGLSAALVWILWFEWAERKFDRKHPPQVIGGKASDQR